MGGWRDGKHTTQPNNTYLRPRLKDLNFPLLNRCLTGAAPSVASPPPRAPPPPLPPVRWGWVGGWFGWALGRAPPPRHGWVGGRERVREGTYRRVCPWFMCGWWVWCVLMLCVVEAGSHSFFPDRVSTLRVACPSAAVCVPGCEWRPRCVRRVARRGMEVGRATWPRQGRWVREGWRKRGEQGWMRCRPKSARRTFFGRLVFHPTEPGRSSLHFILFHMGIVQDVLFCTQPQFSCRGLSYC